ncbi:hypothetical protein EDD11_002486 [Mortierella claussenii]|nr:hypothetical protein EDD11_002486 [Mortierella claussenii]
MAKDTSISFSNRFSLNGHLNTLNSTTAAANSGNNTLSILPVHQKQSPRDRSPDIEAFGNSRTKKSRTPSPPLSPDFTLSFPTLNRRWTKKQPCLLFGVLTVGLLGPIWIFTSGAITLDSFNDAIRYLPGYHYFANNLLYLVMFLLFASFSVLAALPTLPIIVLGLPFHLLIFCIFNKLMSSWLMWCVGCYTVLFLAPVSSTIVARIRSAVLGQYDARRELLIHDKTSSRLSPSSPFSAHIKYSSLLSDYNSTLHYKADSGTFLDHLMNQSRTALAAVLSRIEHCLFLFSTSNRSSTRWRLLLALAFWLSYVVPVTMKNELRVFDPAYAAPSFDIQHPELLCSATMMQGTKPRFDSFEGYWQDYLQFHRHMVIPEKDGGVADDEKRFLVFQPSDDGLGNRLQALLSSVVMAMVTRRAIVLDWLAMPQCNANFTDLFQQPEGLQWDLNTTLPNHKELDYYKSKPEIWYPYCRNCALRSPIDPDSTWSTLLCEKGLGLNSSTPLVQIFSTQWFLPVIQHNPHWRRELCHMFPHTESHGDNNAFELLAKRLLKPSRAVQQKIDSVMERVPKDVKLIGLQVRRTENNAVGQGIENSFLSCAAQAVEEEEEKAATTGVWGSRRMDSFKEEEKGEENEEEEEGKHGMIQQGHDTSSTNIQKSKFAYYLATDYRPTRAHFQKILGDQLYVLDNTFQAHKAVVPALTLSSEADDHSRNQSTSKGVLGSRDKRELGMEHQVDLDDLHDSLSLSSSSSSLATAKSVSSGSRLSRSTSSSLQIEAVVRNSVQGVQTAVAEMFLLAQADRIISSPYSTFGYFAHGYANVQPNIVKRDGTCIKRRSTQPCFQYWFGFANGGARCDIKATVEMSEDYDCWL